MRVMTTIYIDDEHIKFFKKNRDIKMSYIIRKLLTKYIELSERKTLKNKDNQKVEVQKIESTKVEV